MREIVLDTETTGFKAKGGDRVVEIGCLELINKMPTGETYQQYINPERDMPESAFNVHGLSQEFLAEKPVFRDVYQAFLDFIGDADLVIHNAAFDMGFLEAELATAGAPGLGANRVVDTLELARGRFPFGPNSLDALCKRFGIDNTARVKHGALLDCELLAEVYLELVGGRQPDLTLVTNRQDTDTSQARSSVQVRAQTLAPRLTDAEADAHRNFVKSLSGTPVWRDYDNAVDADDTASGGDG
ncbi:MAG: DNA polymerase III subunit epsilon, partial [Hyphomicrobiales bacterium]